MFTGLLKRFFRRTPPERDVWFEQVMTSQQAGHYAEAVALCESRLAESPDDLDAMQALAAALLAQGRADEGLTCLRKATAARPTDPQLLVTLARVCAAVGHIEEAIENYNRALALRPDSPEAADGLISLLKALERYDEAEDRCRESIGKSGDSAPRRHALAAVLFEQGRVDEAIVELQASLTLQPDAPVVHSDLLRALNYAEGVEPPTVYEAHAAWGRRHARALSENALPHANDADAGRRLRVGYVSPYFRKHAVTFFFESMVEHHDREWFELVLYADVARPDEYSERLRAHGAQWRSTVNVTDAALAQMVRDDRIDILVDLSGHTPRHRLLAFARRPAPVQVTWNGYPNTTGMSEIDYRVTDACCDPPGTTEGLHTEELVRLPGLYMSWRPPADAPGPGPLPMTLAGRVTFGSFNACYKITAGMVRLWARLLREVADSRLILFTVPRGRAEDRLRALFEAEGLGADRVEMRSRVSHEAFLEAHREVDIALDSFPYHGTTTTCFSLWMGVPVVSRVGATHVSRVGLTILSSIGLSRLAAVGPDEYVAAAVALSRNPAELGALRSGLRERMRRSPLTDGLACARALEHACRAMWAKWCASHRDR
ncbi:MAG TPA: tetratricopeptide repeat protein [Burkholderiales bacterium]|nr:tetratricopeptide repeat protein [Burkholderiales bacterium]